MNKIKILYVEDEPFLGKIVRESLESRDFDVEMISDGDRVLQAFERMKPDICVLDIMLPNKDGYAIAKSIRQTNTTTPIIFVTAKTQTEDLLKGFDQGGNDYLRKPFSLEELIARINNLLQITRKPVPSSQDIVTIGQYEFLVGRYELRISGEVRKLSHREAMLLQILCQHQNVNVTRKEVLMHVWGDDSFFNSRNMDVYITKLREYLKKDPAIQIITIKGIGYHFSVG
jgi:DNA-binding response OmpR family regulator